MKPTPRVHLTRRPDGFPLFFFDEDSGPLTPLVDVYELRPVGGLHVDRVPCDNCDGGQINVDPPPERWNDGPIATDCPSCVDGLVWPEWAIGAIGMESLRSLKEDTPPRYLDALLVAAQTRDTERHTNYNTGERCNCGLDPCYVNPDSEPMITGVDPENGSG